MSNIDKLKSAAAKAVDNFDPNVFVETRDVLALLASMEQEPAAWIVKNKATGEMELDEPHAIATNPEYWTDAFPVYAAPQLPQPAVVSFDDWSRKCDLQIELCGREFRDKAQYIWNACRAAMLQGKAEPVNQPYTLPAGMAAVPVEMTPEQMRAVQLNSELGAYASANLTGAYSMFREFWDVAVKSAPNQEGK